MTTLNLDNIDLGSFGPTDDPKKSVEDVVNHQRKQQVSATLGQAIKINPDQHAKINKLSRASGVPADAVASDPESVETDLKLRNIDLTSMMRDNPHTTKFLNDFDHAATSHDDIDNMREVENTVSNLQAPPQPKVEANSEDQTGYLSNITRGVGERVTELLGSLYGFADQAGDYLEEKLPVGGFVFEDSLLPRYAGPEEYAELQGRGMDELVKRTGDILKETNFGYVPRATWDTTKAAYRSGDLANSAIETLAFGVEQGTHSIADMVAAMSVLPAYVIARSQEMGTKRAKNKGLDEATIQETLEAAPFAIGSAILERILPSKIFSGMGKQEVSQVGKEVMNQAAGRLKEVAKATAGGLIIESSTEAVQEGIIEYIGERFGTDAKMTLAEAADQALGGAVGGGVAGGLMSGAASGANIALNGEAVKKADAVTNQVEAEAIRSDGEQRTIDNINDLAQGSKLRERDPESFKQFVEQSDGDNNTQVFIDGAQLKLYLSGKDVANDPALQLLSARVEEAASLNSDVTIPLGEFATSIAGTEHFTALRELMTLSGQTTAPFRQEESQNETREYMTRLMNDAQENASQYVESQQIFETVRQQLVDTGMVNEQNAGVMAQVVPAWAAVYAQKHGMTVQEAYQKSGLIIEGPQTGRLDALQREEIATPEITADKVQERIVNNETPFDRRSSVEGPEVETDQRAADRRSDDVRRDRIANMTPEEQYAAIYTNELTGLDNRRAFEQDIGSAEVVISIDIDSLKSVNDNLGQDTGDQLLKVAANAINDNTTAGRVYHISGDEFYVLGSDRNALTAGLRAAREALKTATVQSDKGTLTGVDFTYGTAGSKNAADSAMKKTKADRESRGERVGRGELPSGMVLNNSDKFEQKERGYYDPSKSLIRLTESADLSTFLHEFAHFMYEMELNAGESVNGTNTKATIHDWFKRNAADVAKEANGYLGKKGAFNQSAFHGTPHQFDKFSLEALGTGEGTQNYGWGLYFAGDKAVADFYGNTITADIPQNDELLNSDQPISSQPAFIEKLGIKTKSVYLATELSPAMSGREIYDRLAQGRTNRGVNGKREASEYLSKLGIPGLTYTDKGSKNFVIWDESKVTITDVNNQERQAERFNQTGETGPSSSSAVTEDDITLYLDGDTTGDADKDAAIRRAAHEQFARGFENYLMEGKAPSRELRNVFRTFARWLTQIYKSVRGNLRVKLDDQMREVFDRLLATEDQIAAAEARSRHAPMFTDAVMAGMTEEEFAKYKAQQSKVADKEAETLRDQLISEITRQTKTWWKEEKQDIIDERLDVLRDEPVYRATEGLRTGEFKIDHATTKEMVGTERTDRRGITSVRVPEQLRGMTVKGAKGVHPDEAAAFFGFNSGDEMLTAIIDAVPIGDKAAAQAEEEMLSRHGDIMHDGTIEQKADEAAQNEERGKLILQELTALRKGANAPALDRATIKQMAQENIAKLSYKSIFPHKYRKAEIRAAQESAASLARGDKQGAAQAKARQVLNYYLGMAANEARNDTLKIVDRMSRYNKKKVREEIQKAENGYWEQLVKILNRFEFRKSATLKQVDEINEDINSWAKARMEEDGDGLVLSAAVLNETFVTHWKNVPYSDLQGINESVKNIEHVARYSNKLTRMGEEIQFNKLVDRWTNHMDNAQPSRFQPQRTNVVKGKNWGRWAMAQMTKIPYMASWLDGGDRVGMSHDILVQPMTDAANAEVELWKNVGNTVMEAIEGRSKADIKRHNRKLYIPEIKDQNNDGNLMGHQVLAVALNTGNQGNLRKMLLGEGWANPDNDAEITLQNPKLQAVLKHMTKSDWDLVQLIWNQMDQLYPQLSEVHRRTTGLTPPKVEASPVQTPHGEYQGGYYPMKYDANRSHQAEVNEERLNAQTDSMFGTIGSIQASVNASATNERTKYYAPVRLSLDVVPGHFQETIHYITHHDAVREINKLIRNKSVADTIKAKLGPEEYAQLKPWLNDIAKDGREQPTKMFWDDMLGRLRFGMTLGTMGFRVTTGLIQISGLSNTIAEVGMKNTMRAMRNVLGGVDNMRDAWDFASSNSKVLNHRTTSMDREIKNAMSRIAGKRGMLAAVQEASMKHIAYIQTYMVDLPSWYAAYMKKLDETGDEQKAYQYGDWVIENVQGSGMTKDLARIMRSQSESGRMFTMFMTFFSALWNMERDLIKGAKSKRYSITTTAAKVAFLFSIPVVFEMLLRGELTDEDDEPGEKLEKALVKTATYPVQSVPFIRDIINGATGEFGYNISPIASLLEGGTRDVPELIARPFTDAEITKGQVKNSSKLVGAAFGIPGINQVWATSEHLYEVLEEGEDFTTREFLFGPKRDK